MTTKPSGNRGIGETDGVIARSGAFKGTVAESFCSGAVRDMPISVKMIGLEDKEGRFG